MKRFGITMGDPCGIGPEICIKALIQRPEYLNRCVIYGSASVLRHYAGKLDYDTEISVIDSAGSAKTNVLNVVDPNSVSVNDIQIGKLSSLGGECAFQYVVNAIREALDEKISSVVTAPLNKEALRMAGHNYAGHTEIFGDYTKGDNYAMLLWSDKLKAIHASTHISLLKACKVTKQREIDVIRLAHQTLCKVGYSNPHIAVAGLNPHAGENSLFGDEELKEIIPAIEACRAEGIRVSGPIPPDTVFLRAVKGEFDIVVAQYHDQGHIPLKLLAFDNGVNITVGLNVVRTSVDHGTAFDIAGTLAAKPDSLICAIEVGEKL